MAKPSSVWKLIFFYSSSNYLHIGLLLVMVIGAIHMNIPRHLVTLTGVGTLLHKTKIQQKMNQWSFLLSIVIYLCQFLCKLRKGKL
jgi:ABC-type xylose transport system permease subunit